MKRVIIGNGIVGLSAAFGLLQRMADTDEIVVVGKLDRPRSATLAAAAMLNSFAEIEAGALEHEIDLFRFELSHRATRMWSKFELELIEAAGTEIPHGCSKCLGCAGGGCFSSGTYVVNNTAADELDDANFNAIIKALEDFNEPHDHVVPRDIPGYKPHQRNRATRAVLIHNEGWFNPRLMVDKMDAALRRSGKVTFIDSEVARLSAENSNISHILLEDEETKVEGDQFLLATGSTVTDVLNRSKLDLGIQRVFYGIGTSVEIRSPDAPLSNTIRTPNRGLACGLYAVPYFQAPDRPNDHIIVGASNFIAPEMHFHGRLTSVESLIDGAMRQINSDFYRAELVRVNVGARPTSQDTYPMLGPTELQNLFVATGTKRDGFHLAPLIAETMSNLMLGAKVDDRFKWFYPDRPLIKIMSRQQAIDKIVKHHMSAAYQHGFEPATTRMPDHLEQQMRDDAERLHDKVGAVDWGLPPEMMDMYRYNHAKS